MRRVNFGDIVNIRDSEREPLNKKERNEIKGSGTYPYIGANGIVDWVDEYLFDEKILCIAEDGGSWGKNEVCTQIYNEKCWVNNHAHVVTAKEKVLTEYLSYYLNYQDLNSFITGTTRGKLNQTNLKKIEIPLPSLSEQKAIVAKLERSQRLIDIDRQMLAKYDELIQSVFLEMFGDPVRNEKGLPRKKIKETGEVITGNTPPKKNPENYGSEIEWVKTTNIVEDQLYPTTAEEYLSEIGKELGRIIPENSLIVCCIAGSLSSIGKCSIVNREVSINQQINAIVPIPDIIDTTFLYAQFLVGKNLIQDASTKSMKGMVSKSKFEKIELLVPDISTQRQFSTLFKKIKNEKQKLWLIKNKSEELFSSLVMVAFG